MDKEILKLLPQKAFKLLSLKETFKVSSAVTKSILSKQLYIDSFQQRAIGWKFDDIELVDKLPLSQESIFTKIEGEKILKVYFSQFFETNLPIHIDLRKNSFSSTTSFSWTPSRIHYLFSSNFLEGVCSLYEGFYSNNDHKFEKGLFQLGMIKESMSEKQMYDIKELFYKHFGEGREADVKFSLEKLQGSFNAIFSYFLTEDIPLNPEFAILGVYLVTLYLTLQDIPHALNVSLAFNEVIQKYSKV